MRVRGIEEEGVVNGRLDLDVGGVEACVFVDGGLLKVSGGIIVAVLTEGGLVDDGDDYFTEGGDSGNAVAVLRVDWEDIEGDAEGSVCDSEPDDFGLLSGHGSSWDIIEEENLFSDNSESFELPGIESEIDGSEVVESNLASIVIDAVDLDNLGRTVRE